MTDILGAPPEGYELFVFLGTATNAKGKSSALWISAAELDKAGPADYDAVRMAAGWYPKKADTTRSIGGLYEIKCDRSEGKQTMWFGTAKYAGQSSHSLIAAFQAVDTNTRDAEYRRKQEAKAKEPVYMRDMARTLAALEAMPRRQALAIADAIHIELRNRILLAKTRG